jgi:hypothetical protein
LTAQRLQAGAQEFNAVPVHDDDGNQVAINLTAF